MYVYMYICIYIYIYIHTHTHTLYLLPYNRQPDIQQASLTGVCHLGSSLSPYPAGPCPEHPLLSTKCVIIYIYTHIYVYISYPPFLNV